MTFRMLSIGFSSDIIGRSVMEVEPTLTAVGDDWIRISFDHWLIWTQRPAPDWCSILKPYTSDKVHLFIVALNLNDRSGWLPPWVWEWISARADQQSREAREILEQYFGPPQNALAPAALNNPPFRLKPPS